MEIVNRDNPVLREIAKEVPLSEIGSPKIKKVLEKMRKALDTQDDGVAIAAPQIGESLRIFVVSKKVFEILHPDDDHSGKGDLVFINPKITKMSKTEKLVEEGCLSVRWLYGKIKRATKASISAYDENGQKFERGGSGLLAQIFQHETDHLNGILFIDNAENLKDVPPRTQSFTKKEKQKRA